ncbi:MAG: transcriptional regulator, TetR family [bacterium]|nr:transcriptional regulator, TetR family [bacterium]
MKTSETPIDHRTRVGQERSARTQNRILEAALGVFAERGPDAPVIDEFVQAAGVARGTFYNHFKSVEELLLATSEWTTRELFQSIEDAMAGIEGPTLRLGVGLRLFFARAQHDAVWCRFVARVWKVGGLELPVRDLDAGIRLGHFRVPGREVAHDLLLGGIREALLRIGERRVPASFADHMTEICLRALCADPRRIAAVLAQELPKLPARVQRRAEPQVVDDARGESRKRARADRAPRPAASRPQQRRR